MGFTTKGWTLGCALLGAVGMSQFPEFAQQYRQHLAGGIGELQEVVGQFDNDAKSQGLTREGAITALANSAEDLPRERAKSMQATIDRYILLLDQWSAINNSKAVFHPFHILKSPDSKILSGTWDIYKPAVPVTAEAAVWSGIGAFFATIFGRIPIFAYRRRRKSRHEMALDKSVSEAD